MELVRIARFVLCSGMASAAAQEVVVFRSEVSLVRVDVQVLDRAHRPVSTLNAEDFVLREQGEVREIRHFNREETPVDLVLLIDVSASMRPHVERIATAARQALQVLGRDDRVALMVFDRLVRERSPLRSRRADVERDFDRLLDEESFRGGTDITRGLVEAARWIGRHARPDARRAIVILTDDQTERERDEERVDRELIRADAVLSALIAPNAMNRGAVFGGGWPGRGGIILGPRGRVSLGGRTRSAGTTQIALASGGDSLRVDDAYALQTTLERIRQRYALHFLVPAGAQPGQQRTIDVALSENADRRYFGASVRFRRTYLVPGRLGDPARAPADRLATVSQTAATPPPGPAPEDASAAPAPQAKAVRRRAAVEDTSGTRGPNPALREPGPAGSVAAPAASGEPPKPRRGWRRVDEPEPPSQDELAPPAPERKRP